MDDMAKTRREGEGWRWEQEEEGLQQKIGGSESRLVGWVIVWEGCKVGYQKRRMGNRDVSRKLGEKQMVRVRKGRIGLRGRYLHGG